MGWLTQRHVRALLKGLQEVYANANLETFPFQVLSALPHVVPTEATGYNEVDLLKRQARTVVEPAEILPPEHERLLVEHIDEHPLITYYQRTQDGQARTISDFLTRSQFHHLGLYNEFYRPMGIEDQMAIVLPMPPPLILGIVVNRGRRSFSEHDRLLLNLLRPHLIQAYHNAEAVSRLQQELAQLRQAVEESNSGIITLAGNGRVLLMTERARCWVEAYFGKLPQHARGLPDTLRCWVASSTSPSPL